MPKVVDHDEERRKLMHTAFRYITQYGLLDLSLRNLAAAQGVTKGYVQHYYDSKEQVMVAIIDFVENSFHDLMEVAITDSFDLACYRLHQMLPVDAKRRGLWRVKFELGLLTAKSEIIKDTIEFWYLEEIKTGAKLLKKAKAQKSCQTDLSPEKAYRSLLALVYGCAVTVNTNIKPFPPKEQKRLLDKAILDLS